MAKKIKYNSEYLRWELLEDGVVLAFAEGPSSSNPWDVNGGVWPYADGSDNYYQLTQGGTVDATATGADIIEGKTAYARGVRLTGTIGVTTPTLTDNVFEVKKGVVKQDTVLSVPESGAVTIEDNIVTIPSGYAKEARTAEIALADSPSMVDNEIVVYKGFNKEEKVLVVAKAASPTVDGNTVTIHKGYIAEEQNITVPGIDTSDANAKPEDIVYGSTAYVNGQKIMGTASVLEGEPIRPSASRVDLEDGFYRNSFVVGDSNLKSENIKEGISIFGVDGTLKEGTDADLTNLTAENIKYGVTVNGVAGTFTQDAVIMSNVIPVGFSAYAQGDKIEGTASWTESANLNVMNGSKTDMDSGFMVELDISDGFYQNTTVFANYENLVSENVRKGITIGDTGVTGTLVEGEDIEFGYVTEDGKFQQVDITGNSPTDVGSAETIESVYVFATGQDEPDYTVTIDTTATADDIVAGKTAVIDGMLVTGTMSEASVSVKDNVVTISAGHKSEQDTVTVGTAIEAMEYTPGEEAIVIPAGSYLKGDQIIKAIANMGSSDVVYGVLNENGEFQELDLTNEPVAGSTEAFSSLDMYETGVEEPEYIASCDSIKFYECASVSMSRAMNSNTWSGYPMIFTGNSWKTDYNLVEGLTYGATVPEVGYIYSEDATIKIGTMYQELEGIELEFTEPEYSNLGGTYKKKEDVTDFVLLDEDTGNTITATGGSYYISGSEVSAPVGSDGPSIEDVARTTWVDRNGNYPKSKSKKLYYDPPTGDDSSSSVDTPSVPTGATNVIIDATVLDYGNTYTFSMYPVNNNAVGCTRSWSGSNDHGFFDLYGFNNTTWTFESSVGFRLYTEELSNDSDPWTATWVEYEEDNRGTRILSISARPIDDNN